MTRAPAPAPGARPFWRAWAIALAILVLLAGGLLALARFGPATAPGRRFIERSLDGLKVGTLGRLHVQGLAGDPWSNFTLASASLADKNGVWLEASRITVRWRPRDLVRGEAHIQSLVAQDVRIARRPVLTPAGPHHPAPVSVRIDAAATRVQIDPAAAGRRGDYNLKGALLRDRQGETKGEVRVDSRLHLGDFAAARFDIGAMKAFHLDLDAEEAQGGALAGLLGLPADRPFQATARASGGAEAGHFQIVSRVGAATPLEATGAWTAAGGGAKGRIDLGASSLLQRFRDLAGPGLDFDIAARRTSGTAYQTVLSARGATLALDAKGLIEPGKVATGPAGLAVDLRLADPAKVLASPKLGPVRFLGTLTGDRSRWSLGGQTTLQRVGLGPYDLAQVQGPVTVSGAGGEIALSARLAGRGGSGAGLPGALLGAAPTLSAEATLFADGRALIRRLTVQGAGVRLAAEGGKSLFGGLNFTGQADLANVGLLHSGSRGRLSGAWRARQAGANQPWAFAFDAMGQGFALGQPQVDPLIGAAPRLRASGTFEEGVLRIADARLDGAAGAVTAAGRVGPDQALALRLGWRLAGPLDAGPLRITGALNGSGDITGALSAPRADLSSQIAQVDVPGLPLRNVQLTLVAGVKGAGGDGRLVIKGDSDFGPALASGLFKVVDKGLSLSDLALSAGGAKAAGSLDLRQGAPSAAELTFEMGPGAFLAEGRIHGRARVTGGAGMTAQAEVNVKGEAVAPAPGGLVVHAFDLAAKGPMDRLPYRLAAEGEAPAGIWRVAGEGLLSEHRPDRDATFQGAGRLGRVEIKTLSPLHLALGPQGLSGGGDLDVGGGRARLLVEQRAETLRAEGDFAGVSLALFDEDLVGQMSGKVNLIGKGAELTGDMHAKLAGAGGRDMEGLSHVDGVIDAALRPGALTVKANFNSPQALAATAEVALPVEASASPFHLSLPSRRPLSGHFAIDGELRPLWELAVGGSQSLSGHVVAQGEIGGTLADPQATGRAALDDGRFRDSETGLRLEAITLRATLAKDAVEVGQFSASDGAKGGVQGSGRASLEREGASTFRVDLKHFRLIDNDLARATASGSLTVNRAASGRVRVSGALVVDRAVISPKAPVVTGVVPMEVVEIHQPKTETNRFAPPPARDAPLGLDVAITAPGAVLVQGKGLNLELALDAKVSGTTAAPDLAGRARVVRGDYDFAGQRFQFDDTGVIQLGATAEAIRLDLKATREDPTLTAVVRITGTAAKPVIALSSTPALPQDEILSQVLFGSSAAQLTGLQAAQLASALAGLSNGGLDVIGGLRAFARLDRLSIGGTSATGPTVSGGKYLTDRLYLEVTGGGREGQGAQMAWRVRKHVSVVAKVGSQGDSQISIRWRRDY
jgi:translocation and assembly module TamB